MTRRSVEWMIFTQITIIKRLRAPSIGARKRQRSAHLERVAVSTRLDNASANAFTRHHPTAQRDCAGAVQSILARAHCCRVVEKMHYFCLLPTRRERMLGALRIVHLRRRFDHSEQALHLSITPKTNVSEIHTTLGRSSAKAQQ